MICGLGFRVLRHRPPVSGSYMDLYRDSLLHFSLLEGPWYSSATSKCNARPSITTLGDLMG